jgi:hypothetical protein
MFLLVIINDLHVRRAGGVFGPFKASPPLIIDANAVLSLPVSSQRFKTVTGQYGKVFKHDGRLQSVQLQTGGTFDSRECLYPLTGGEDPGSLVPVTQDHDSG